MLPNVALGEFVPAVFDNERPIFITGCSKVALITEVDTFEQFFLVKEHEFIFALDLGKVQDEGFSLFLLETVVQLAEVLLSDFV
jgi:hypothetical protein